jgi:hypothetical protein
MTTPTDDLKQRCAEVIEWQRTGELPGDALRNYAAKHWAGRHDSLQMAERDTSEQAMTAIAKWGQPQAGAGGEPIGHLYCGGSYGDELADWEIVADQLQCDKLNEHHGALGQEAKLPIYTAPPPQAVREPRVSEDQWRVLCEQTWDLLEAQDRSAARQLLLDGFKARGITKGGQHG